jgi:hypothetical protein
MPGARLPANTAEPDGFGLGLRECRQMGFRVGAAGKHGRTVQPLALAAATRPRIDPVSETEGHHPGTPP